MTKDSALPGIAWLRLGFDNVTTAEIVPTVNEWRSVFGKDLRRHECAAGAADCSSCAGRTDCLYSYVFDTPPPPGVGWMQGVERVPHPMLLRAVSDASDHGTTLEVVLFGRATGLAERVVRSLARAGAGGIGPRHARVRWQLRSVRTRAGLHESWRSLNVHDPAGWTIRPVDTRAPACPPAAAIEFVSPVRIQRQGRPIGPAELTFAELYASLLRRLSSVSRFHAGIDWQADFRGLIEQARSVRLVGPRLRWQETVRYSARQQATMRLGGIVGSVVAEGDLAPFWPHLWAGQWLHAGKATFFGLGHYTVNTAASAGAAVGLGAAAVRSSSANL